MAKNSWREESGDKSAQPIKKAPGKPFQFGTITRVISILMLATAIIWVTIILLNIKPLKKTVWFNYTFVANQEKASGWSGNAFLPETTNQLSNLFGQRNSNILSADIDSTDQAFGPDKNVAMFYVHGQLFLDSENQVHLLKNQKDLVDYPSTSPTDAKQKNWESLASILTNISTKKIGVQHRIVVLDICQFDYQAAAQLNSQKLPQLVRGVLDQLTNEKVENSQQLWVMMSFGNESVGWHAPELHSTVFGYFVAQGLRGWAASKPENNTIQLAELFEFARSAVSTWVRDYRGSTQIPVLMSTRYKDEQEAIQRAQEVNVVFNDLALDAPTPTTGQVQSNVVKLDNLWGDYHTRLDQLESMPHQKAMLESRLLRMEQLSFSQNEPAFQDLLLKTQSLVDELEKQSRFQSGEESQFTSLSIADKLASNKLAITANDKSNFEQFLQLKSRQAIIPNPNATKAEAESYEKTKADDKKNLIKIVEALDALTTQQRVAIAWKFLITDSNAPITQPTFNQCISFINQGVSASDSMLSIEAQFLNLVKSNLDWLPAQESQVKQQRLLQLIIQCRGISESIAQASAINGFSPADHARIWSHFEERFKDLETRRRNVEDRFLAGELDAALSTFNGTDNQDLKSELENLSSQIKSTLSALRSSREVFDISPHIRSVLARKSMFQSHSTATADQLLKHLVAAEIAAANVNQLIGSPTIPAFGELISKEQTSLQSSLGSLRASADNQWIKPINDATKDATDGTLVFNALNILQSTIPEWVARNEDESSREKIRNKVTDWIIKYQRPKLFDNWENFLTAIRSPEQPPALGTLFAVSTAEFDAVVKSATFANLSPAFLARPATSGWPDLPLPTTKSNEQFTKPISLGSMDDIVQEQNRLFQIDSDLRLLRTSLGYSNSSLDVGGRLALLDRLVMDQTKFERSIHDLWGTGNVAIAANTPPFLQYSNAYQQQLGTRLKQLEEFVVETQADRREWPKVYDKGTKPLRDQIAKRQKSVADFWNDVRDRKISWTNASGEPLEKEFMAGTSVEFVAKLEPIKWNQMDTRLTSIVGKKILSWNGNSDRRVLNDNFEFKHSLTSNQLNRKTNELGAQFDWRGHWFSGKQLITRVEPEKPKIIVARSTLERIPTTSGVVVQNNNDIFADIMFVLDCSGSMGKKVQGKLQEGNNEESSDTRLHFSKNALTATLAYLQKEERCRFGFAAFAHRARFLTKKSEVDGSMRYIPDSNRGGRYKYISSDSTVHPFNDYQTIFRFDDNGDDPVSSKFNVETLVRIIEESDKAPEDKVLVPNGVTPLYLSIVTAGGELALSDNQQKILVVLTDGRDLQMPDSRALPDGVEEGARTTLDDVSSFLGANPNVKLYVIHVGSVDEVQDSSSQPDPKFKELATKYKNFDFVTVDDNDSQAISKEILNAIGRNRYSIHEGTADGNQFDELRIGDQRPDIPNGRYTVKTNVKENPDQIQIELKGGESVFMVNSKKGLLLNKNKHNNLKFLEFNGVPQKANLKLGGPTYDVGLLAPKSDIRSSGVRVGFAKDTLETFAFRPQRIWVEIKDNNSSWKTNLLQHFFEPGEDPIASFQLASEIRPRLSNVDMRVWIVPNQYDDGPNLEASQNKRWPGGNPFQLQPGLNDEFDGIDFNCNLKKVSDTLFTVTVNGDGTGRPYLIDCPSATKITRRITFANDTQTSDEFEFQIPEGAQTEFTLYIQPDSTKPQDKVRQQGQIQHGEGVDPIFGDQAQWIEFKNIDLGK